MTEDDFDIVSVQQIKPTPFYFLPVVAFIILLFFNRVGVYLPSGYINALVGLQVVNVLILMALVGFGVVTDHWYYIYSVADTTRERIIIGVLALFTTQFSFYVLRYYYMWYPDLDTILWFIYGFIAFEIMLKASNYLMKQDYGDTRYNVILAISISTIVGIVPIYLAIMMGWWA